MSRARPPERSGDEEVSEGEPGQQAYGLGRILALSDGVFAFSLTLLVVSLSVPSATSNSDLASQLAGEAPTFFSYIISFVAVASIWYGHHESFKYIRRYDGRLIALNFGSVLLIAFLPFPTAVLGRNQQEPLAAILYALTLALSNLFFAATWWHASHGRRLVEATCRHKSCGSVSIGPWAALSYFSYRFPSRCGDRLQPRSSGPCFW